MKTLYLRAAATAAFAMTALASSGAQAQTVKIGYIDPLSGPFANVGEAGLKQFQFVVDDINARIESYVLAQPTSCQMKRPAKP